MNILGDQPINDAADDALDRTSYAAHIATGILKWESKESLCMALHGSWGSGKTSLLNLSLGAIRDKTRDLLVKDRPIIMRFQPWLISGQEQLISSFLGELRKTLGKPELSKYANEASKQLETFENLLGYAKWIPKVGRVADQIKDIIGKLRGTAQTVAKQLEGDLESNKEAINEALSKLRSPVIIVIDDVDRLTNQEIRQLFQLIKAVADFPRTVYILAFDHMLVEKALETFQEGSDTRYLEKIVQLSFEVPSPSRSQIAAVLLNGFDEIKKSLSPDKYEQARWNELRFGPLVSICRNIRDVKRYLNAVNFMFPIIKDEVNIVDLIIIEAMHVFAPDLYKAVKNNKDYLVSDSFRVLSRSAEDKEKNDWIETLPALGPEYCRKEMKEMLSHLFPEIQSRFSNFGWGDEFEEIWTKNRRVCISPFFDYYFRGTLPEGEVSAREIEQTIALLYERDNLTLLLRNYISDARILKLLPWIERYIEANISEEVIQNIISALFEAGEEIPLKPDTMSDIPLDWRIQATIYRLLKLLDISKRKDVLIKSIEASENAIVYPIAIVSWIWKEWYPTDEDKEKSDEDKLLGKIEADEAQEVTLALIKRYKDSNILYKSRQLSATLYYWKKWGDVEEVKEWVAHILSDAKKIPEFLGGFGSFYSTSGMGSHYQTHHFRIKVKSLEYVCDVYELKNRCEKLLADGPTWMSANDREILKVFLKDFDNQDEDL